MKPQLIIGLGVVGRALLSLYQEAGVQDVYGIDIKEHCHQKIDCMHICFPWSPGFIESVLWYGKAYTPDVTIVHSTVPIGTTKQIPDAVHSPVMGNHSNMQHALGKTKKWIGGPLADQARSYLRLADISCRCVPNSDTTEALKLMSLAKYGMSITFAKYQQGICDDLDFDYGEVLMWDRAYNGAVSEDLRRPLLTPPGDYIGGSCVIPAVRMLNWEYPSRTLTEILKLAKKE